MSLSLHDEISLTSLKNDFDKYSFQALRSDLIAGLSVAMLAVPQAMAYALAAGLPVSCGLIAAIFSALIAAFFGSSRHLVVGPSNAVAILIQAGISLILFTHYREASGAVREALVFQILSQIMLLVGVIQILAAFLKLGRLTHFVSHPVIVAYLSGVALALVINQLFPFLGMDIPQNLSSLYERGSYILLNLHLVHIPTALIGVACFGILILVKKLDRKIPAGAIMLAFIALATYFLSHSYYYFYENGYEFVDWLKVDAFFQGIHVVGETSGDGLMPRFEWPYFNASLLNSILPVAFAIAVLSLVEATSAAKGIAANSGQRLSTNQEFFGVGIGNFVSAFIGAMPISGSSSRTAVNYENGGKTRISVISSSIFVWIILLAFGVLIRDIPVAAFSALLIFSAGSIINFKQVFLCLKATRSDAMVFSWTLLSCIFLSLDIAFYIGVIMSISLYLKKSAMPQLVEYTVDDTGGIHSLDSHGPQEPRKIRFIKVEGELFFGAADLFQSALKSLTEDDTTTRVLIIQLKNARDIDATACLALQQLHSFLKNSGRSLIACGITHQIWEVLSDSDMIDIIGKNNLFIFDEKLPQQSVLRAFARAKELLDVRLPDLVPTLVELESEPVPVSVPVRTDS